MRFHRMLIPVLTGVLMATSAASAVAATPQSKTVSGVAVVALPPPLSAPALAALRQQAEQGVASAQVKLGMIYQSGRGVRRDYGEAAKWYRRAAEQGNASGQAEMGFAYYRGQGVPQDFEKALTCGREAAAQGNALGQLFLGMMYVGGHGVPQSFVGGYKWFMLAEANRTDSEAATLARAMMAVLAKGMTPAQIEQARQEASKELPARAPAVTSAGLLPRGQNTPSFAQILAESKSAEWRRPDPRDLLVMHLSSGRIVMELDPAYAPLHVANIKTLVRERYFDGLAIVRVQDDFVAQWDDPEADDGGDRSKVRPLGSAKATVPSEFTRPIEPSFPWVGLPDGDVYAPQVGFAADFPAARDPATDETWLIHCYGTLAVSRDDAPDSGNGSGLYVAIGQAPRRLDRNLTVVGRVVQGMDILSALPRGHGPLGFYVHPQERTPILDIRVAADLPPAQRPRIEILRTGSPTFQRLLEAARSRHDEFYSTPPGKVDICAVPAPVRELSKP